MSTPLVAPSIYQFRAVLLGINALI